MSYTPNSTRLVEVQTPEALADLRHGNQRMLKQIKEKACVSFTAVIGTGVGMPGPPDMHVTVTVAEGKPTTVETHFDVGANVEQTTMIEHLGPVGYANYLKDAYTSVLGYIDHHAKSMVTSMKKGPIIAAEKPAEEIPAAHSTYAMRMGRGGYPLGGMIALMSNPGGMAEMLRVSLQDAAEGIHIDTTPVEGDGEDAMELANELLEDLASMSSQDSIELLAIIQAEEVIPADKRKALMQKLMDIRQEMEHLETNINQAMETLISRL